MKKKLMITGSFPPDICGVGDYTSCFMSSHDTGIENWSLYYSKEWSLKLLKKKISVLNSYNTESIFLQYPTQGYGWSLLLILRETILKSYSPLLVNDFIL